MVRLGDVNPMVWDSTTEEMEDSLKEFEFQAEDITVDWRIDAARKRLDRELFEQYGYLKDIILHPYFQQTKTFLEQNVDFSIQLGEPMIPLATSVIILFMMYKRVSNSILLLAAAFCFNINPLYVVLGALVYWLYFTNNKPKDFVKGRHLSEKDPALAVQGALPFSKYDSDRIQSDYDHVLVGSDFGTLYTAALLSRVGHRCVVLQPAGATPIQVQPPNAPCAVPLESVSIGKAERYQSLLDAIQSSDAKLRTTLTPIGTPADGFTSTVIRHNDGTKATNNRRGNLPPGTLWSVRAGEGSLASDMLLTYALDKAELLNFLKATADTFSFVTSYLYAKCVSLSQRAVIMNDKEAQTFSMLGARTVDAHLSVFTQQRQAANTASQAQGRGDHYAPLASVSIAGMGEALPAADVSTLGLAGALSSTQGGAFYPSGGLSSLAQNCMRTIRKCGGEIYADVPVRTIVLEGEGKQRRAVGISYALNSKAEGEDDDDVIYAKKSVISGCGALGTYLNLLPAADVCDETRSSLSLLSEMRPKVYVLMWLQGTSTELGLSTSDYVELAPQTGRETRNKEEFAGTYMRLWSPSAKDSTWSNGKYAGVQTVVVEFEATEPHVVPKVHKFSEPATPDPTASTNFAATPNPATPNGPIVYKDGDGVSGSGKAPAAPSACAGKAIELSRSQKEKYRLRAELKLREVYPLTAGKVMECTYVQSPVVGELRCVSGTPGKYQPSNSNSALTAGASVQGLFLTGRDIATAGLMGDIQGGWASANAVLGYTGAELLMGRNVIHDLENVKKL
jgi:hypothetical protein